MTNNRPGTARSPRDQAAGLAQPIVVGPRGPVIVTNSARCRDCYRCVRGCPIKAIRVDDDQASVVAERCIACGTCVTNCPQSAKVVRRDSDLVADLLAGSQPVAASVAPSFAAALPVWQQRRLPALLRQLGFKHVAETAIGAAQVAEQTRQLADAAPSERHLCTACPAFVRFVQAYHHSACDELLPVVSPMLAHAAAIREQLGAQWKVVFIGPCFAKKMEADSSTGVHRIDAAITFQECLDWFAQAGASFDHCEESDFDGSAPTMARGFPLEGGSLLTAGIDRARSLHVSGHEAIVDCLDDHDLPPLVIDALYCQHGCINGPGMPDGSGIFSRQIAIQRFQAEQRGPATSIPAAGDLHQDLPTLDTGARLIDDEATIREILSATGKHEPDDELDCGACGYDSCRAKAQAVAAGMAEVGMCLPWMRRMAEQRGDRIMATSPNGMVVVDRDLMVQAINPAFRSLFRCSDAAIAHPLSRILDPDPFEIAWSQPDAPHTTVITYGQRQPRTLRLLVYLMPDEDRAVGVFTDITAERRDRASLQQLRSSTITQAEELLHHQVEMAQQLARYLGESTARGQSLVEELRRSAHRDGDEP